MMQCNLNLVLTFLMCTPFEPMHSCPLCLLTIKRVLLIAITSARRVSKLQVLAMKQPYTSFFLGKLVHWTKAKFPLEVVTSFHVDFLCSASSLVRTRDHCWGINILWASLKRNTGRRFFFFYNNRLPATHPGVRIQRLS